MSISQISPCPRKPTSSWNGDNRSSLSDRLFLHRTADIYDIVGDVPRRAPVATLGAILRTVADLGGGLDC
jgi:hypothetical protein